MFEFGRFNDSIFAAFFCAFLNIVFTFPELEEELYHLEEEDDDEDNGCFNEDTSWILPVLVVVVAAAVVFMVVVVVVGVVRVDVVKVVGVVGAVADGDDELENIGVRGGSEGAVTSLASPSNEAERSCSVDSGSISTTISVMFGSIFTV